MSGAGQQTTIEQGGQPSAADLALVNTLEDEGKDEAELWAEAEAEEAAAAGKTSDSDGAPAERAPASDDDEAAAAAAEASADDDSPDKGDGGDSPDGQGRQEAKDGQTQSKTEDGKGDATDPFADAPEPLRKAHEATVAELETLRKRDEGHRRHLNGLQRKVRELEQGRGTGDQAKPAGDTAAVDLESDEGWKSFKEDYPDVAAPVAAALKKQAEKIAELEQGQTRIQKDRTEADLAEQQSLLAQEHEDWLTVTADESFANWIEDQPRYVQQAIARNAEQIVDAEEAGDVIARFKAFRSSEDPGGSANGAGADDGDQQTGNDDLTKRRQRQRNSASSARSTGPGTTTGIPDSDDEEAIWKAMDAQERREAARANG